MNNKRLFRLDEYDRPKLKINDENYELIELLRPKKQVDEIAKIFALNIPTMFIPPPVSIVTNLLYSMYL